MTCSGLKYLHFLVLLKLHSSWITHGLALGSRSVVAPLSLCPTTLQCLSCFLFNNPSELGFSFDHLGGHYLAGFQVL